MFGYVRPFKGEMLVKEYDAYKGVYCQLCRALGKYYGFPMRLTLSYDCTPVSYTHLTLPTKA